MWLQFAAKWDSILGPEYASENHTVDLGEVKILCWKKETNARLQKMKLCKSANEEDCNDLGGFEVISECCLRKDLFGRAALQSGLFAGNSGPTVISFMCTVVNYWFSNVHLRLTADFKTWVLWCGTFFLCNCIDFMQHAQFIYHNSSSAPDCQGSKLCWCCSTWEATFWNGSSGSGAKF